MTKAFQAPFTVPNENHDLFECFVLDPGITEAGWITGVQVNAGNRSVAHHALVFLDNKAESEALATDGHFSCFSNPNIAVSLIAAWAPGAVPTSLPENAGIPVSPGARLVVQMHYHPTAQAEIDQSSVSLKLTTTRPEYVVSRLGEALPAETRRGRLGARSQSGQESLTAGTEEGRMKLTTTCNESGFKEHGHKWLETVNLLPKTAEVVLYTEGFETEGVKTKRCEDLPRLTAFKDKYKHYKPVGWEWDIVRFSHKVFTVYDAFYDCEDLCVWMDADCILKQQIPEGYIERLLPEGSFMALFKRTGMQFLKNYFTYREIIQGKLPPKDSGSAETVSSITRLRHFVCYNPCYGSSLVSPTP